MVMLCKLYKLMQERHNEIPYTSFENNENCSISSSQPKLESNSSDDSLPSPFREIKMLREPKDGKLTSLGLISVGMALTGLAVLVDLRAEEAAAKKAAAQKVAAIKAAAEEAAIKEVSKKLASDGSADGPVNIN